MAGRASKQVIWCSDRPSACPLGRGQHGRARGTECVLGTECCPHAGCVSLCSRFVCIHVRAATLRPGRVPGGGSALSSFLSPDAVLLYLLPARDPSLRPGKLVLGFTFPIYTPLSRERSPQASVSWEAQVAESLGTCLSSLSHCSVFSPWKVNCEEGCRRSSPLPSQAGKREPYCG